MKKLQDEIVEWADSVFPNRNPQQGFLKLFEELGEVIRTPHDPLEWADVFIMLFDLANHYGVNDLDQHIQKKMHINKNRKWIMNEVGVMQHDREAEFDGLKVLVSFIGGPFDGEERYFDSPLDDTIEMGADDEGVRFIYSRCLGADDGMKCYYSLYRVIQ